jgi:microfibrillar-associated protein 1
LIHRHIHAPQILEVGASDEEKEKHQVGKMAESEEEEEEDELSDEEIERRRQTLRQKVLNHKEEEVCFTSGCLYCVVEVWHYCVVLVVQEVEVLDKEEEGHSHEESASESSEYEEYTGQ